MGVYDEHWCSRCRRVLNKEKDRYFVVEELNADEKKLAKDGEHARAFICAECYEKDEPLKDSITKMKKKGNPTFACSVNCAAWEKCADFQPAKDKRVNCRHIYVLKDKLYCARKHPGKTEVGQDSVAVDQERMTWFMRFMKKAQGGALAKTLGAAFSAVGLATPVKLDGLVTDRVPNVILPEPVLPKKEKGK